ncbi:hypothetical protein LUZ60_000365 [Juncus effusus]|nr:hypothetical protein LUZ60_000365 [Juncus effusus]
MDAKDILGLPKTAFPANQEKKSRTPKEPQRRPDGVHREVYALTGGVAPLMPGLEPSHLKKRPIVGKEKIAWKWLPFTSSARTDNLQLYHWVRVVNGNPPTGDYAFAKYNKSVDVQKYTDEEYEKYLTDNAWTKEETHELFELCKRFDLRFTIIADRFSKDKSVEELKARYYYVTRKLLIARAASPDEVSNHPLVKEQYNLKQETERKRALSAILSQPKNQDRKDSEVLAEAKRIKETRPPTKSEEEGEEAGGGKNEEGNGEKLTEETSSPVPTSTPVQTDNNNNNTSSIPASLRMLKVYLRSQALEQMVQAVSSTSGRTNAHVEQMVQELGVNVKPKVPTKSVCAEHLELRKEILTLLNLQKQVQVQKGLDATSSQGPSTPKRSNRDVDRPFNPDSVGFGGERTSKRDQRRKAPGRFVEPPSSPSQSKRPSKFKSTA